MKRIALLIAAAGAVAATALPAHATIVRCEPFPVFFSCYHWTGDHYEFCRIYVAGDCLNP